MKKPKIKISLRAYEYLLDALNSCEEFDVIRLELLTKCCGSKIDIHLDNKTELYNIDLIDELPVMYDKIFYNNVKEVVIIYENSSIKVKHTLNEGLIPTAKKSCNKKSCNKK